MLFNSIDFILFFPLVFILHWFVIRQEVKFQNILLLFASFYFYACWDWRFLFLLIFSISLDYFAGRKIAATVSTSQKKFWLFLSIGINLGFLGVFKYYNFFVDSFAEIVSRFGFHPSFTTLHIIIPVGISFYTFHGLSYIIDIYKNRIQPEKNLVTYSVFVSFFPLLVAGPIERATHLLPQLKKKRTFDYQNAIAGLKQILWGLFKKVVIADTCATFVDLIFANYTDFSGSTLFLGAVFFAFQIYGDFSGYSDIALGTARLLGISLLKNFSYPYFSRDIAEFWRRWHISLTTWFRDYLYIPMGGSKVGTPKKVLNVFVIFLVSGFWHGANWTFIYWGLINALYFLPLLLLNKNRENTSVTASGKMLPGLKELMQMLFTFVLVVFAWIFFRADDLHQALTYISGVFSNSFFSIPSFPDRKNGFICLLLILFFLVIEWRGRENEYCLEKFGQRWPQKVRWVFYYGLMISLFYFAGKEEQFIYFQF